MHIVADIGGTKTRIAGSSDLESMTDPIVIDTPQSYAEGLSALETAVKVITKGESVEHIAAGIRGFVAPDKSAMLKDQIIPDWAQKPLANDLKKMMGAKSAQLENDTGLVGLGEAVFGAGKGAAIVVYMTVSTGINGTRIIDGKIDRSHQGFEIGGQYLSMVPEKSIEDLISGTAVAERFGKHPKDLGKDNPVWGELAKVAAYSVHNTILHWSPERMILGGSMFNDVGISVARVAEHVKTIMKKFPTTPEIVHASLGDIGGLWGGLALLRQKNQSI